ncbi:MAG: endonuclease [Bacteroidota bacterium]
MTKSEHAIAFYNLENLFDTVDDPHTLDDDFTPKGFKRWKDSRYGSKIKKLGKAISRIGEDEDVHPPVLLGIAEVENGKVVEKLLKTKYLRDIPFDYVHFDSPDERGIDTGLIYNKHYFKVVATETLPLLIENENGDRDFTRDILYVNGKLNNEEIHVFVNHWPSRRDGVDETKYKRVEAANTILRKINTLNVQSEKLNVMIMGDFNDDPNSESIQVLMESGLFINPFKKLLSPNSGSANYGGKWSLFDQIILSHSFLNHEAGTHSFGKATIFAPRFLKEWKGRYKGNPFRTFAGKKYIGGYSDHFPVYVLMHFND